MNGEELRARLSKILGRPVSHEEFTRMIIFEGLVQLEKKIEKWEAKNGSNDS